LEQDLKKETGTMLVAAHRYYVGLYRELLREKKIHGRRRRLFVRERLQKEIQSVIGACRLAERALREENGMVVADFFQSTGKMRGALRPAFIDTPVAHVAHRCFRRAAEATDTALWSLEMRLRESIG